MLISNATRPITPPAISPSVKIKGPAFLGQEKGEGPQKPGEIPDTPNDYRDLKRNKVQVHMTVQQCSQTSFLARHSSFDRLVTSVKWLPFFKNSLCLQYAVKVVLSSNKLGFVE